MKKIYISGPMTGLPDLNREAFYDAEDVLKLAYPDAHILNPASIPESPEKKYGDYLREALQMQLQANCVFHLPGWQNSRGALIEHMVAVMTGMEIL